MIIAGGAVARKPTPTMGLQGGLGLVHLPTGAARACAEESQKCLGYYQLI